MGINGYAKTGPLAQPRLFAKIPAAHLPPNRRINLDILITETPTVGERVIHNFKELYGRELPYRMSLRSTASDIKFSL